MDSWWDEYAEERDPQQDAATAANAVAASAEQDDPYAAYFDYTSPQEMPPLTEVDVDTLRAPGQGEPFSFSQKIGPVDYGYIPDASPAAVADALDNRGFVGNAINGFFGGAGKIAGGALDKMFGTRAEYDAQQADLQRRLALPDDPAAMYTPHKPSVFGGTLGLIPTALQKMGLDVQDMTPYGFALMDQDEAAARATSGLPEPSDSSSDDNYIPLGGTPPAAPIRPQSGYAPGGMGGASRSVKFSGYPDFTKPNPYG